LFISPNEIYSTYEFLECQNWLYNISTTSRYCISYVTSSVNVTPLTPPFLYYNLCGSVILTSYIPVYIYMYIINIIMTVISPYIYNIIYHNNINIIKYIQPLIMNIVWPQINIQQHHTNNTNLLLDNTKNICSRWLLRVDEVVTNLLHHISILLTFGLTCPILSIIITSYISIYIMILYILIGRYVYYKTNSNGITTITTSTNDSRNNYTNSNDTSSISRSNVSNFTSNDSINSIICDDNESMILLDYACLDINNHVYNCMWEVVYMSSIFIALLSWDVASDKVSWKESLWFPCVSISIPFILWLFNCIYWRYYNPIFNICVRRDNSTVRVQKEILLTENVNLSIRNY
jgi:hypothetical protein